MCPLEGFENVNQRCGTEFVKQMIPQVRFCQRKGMITPKSFGTWNIKFQHIPARMKVAWRFMRERYGSDVPRTHHVACTYMSNPLDIRTQIS